MAHTAKIQAHLFILCVYLCDNNKQTTELQLWSQKCLSQRSMVSERTPFVTSACSDDIMEGYKQTPVTTETSPV